jgi:hypothetical protein
MGEVVLDGALGLNRYVRIFGDKDITPNPGTIWVDAKYLQDRNSDIYRQIAALDYRSNSIDSTLELALAVQYTRAVKDRPVEAVKILPEGRASDVILVAATHAKLQMLKFLDPENRDRIGRYELMIRTLMQRNNITQAEINTGIRALISGTVDEEFNEISFLIDNYSANSRFSYNAVLTRTAQNQYILSYERPDVPNSRKETDPVSSLDALSSAMRNSGDFVPAAINTVRAQAALIPAVVLSDNALNEIKTTLTNFYTTPNAKTYACAKETHIVLQSVLLSTRNIRYGEVYHAYERVLSELNEGLAQKVLADVRASSRISTLTTAQQRTLVELR